MASPFVLSSADFSGMAESMDYEVFLLMRMQEVWRRTGNNSQAVAIGLQKTGGMITSAALLFVLVFRLVSVHITGCDERTGPGNISIVFLAAMLLWLALILFWSLFRRAHSDPWRTHLRAMRRSRGQGSNILDDSPRYPWIGRGIDGFW